ncbi:MAG TPA: hypothetical protein VLA52_10860 [Thermohalobaculum sp.]|nr:hypothetical protein [Thermohalobaculum sp.]
MKAVSHKLAVALILAGMMAGCAAQPKDPPEASAPVSSAGAAGPVPGTDFRAGDPWPGSASGDARPLRDVTVKVDVPAREKRILEPGQTGFVVIREEASAANGFRMGQTAKLEYRNGQAAVYRMPVGMYSVRALGAEYPCEPASFHVPEASQDEARVEIEVGSVTDAEAKMTLSYPGTRESDTAEAESLPPVASQRSIRWCGAGREAEASKPISVAGGVALGAGGGALYGAGYGVAGCFPSGPMIPLCAIIMAPIGAAAGLVIGGVAGGVMASKQQKAAAGTGGLRAARPAELPASDAPAAEPASDTPAAQPAVEPAIAQAAEGAQPDARAEGFTEAVNGRRVSFHDCQDLATGGLPNPWTELACERAGFWPP